MATHQQDEVAANLQKQLIFYQQQDPFCRFYGVRIVALQLGYAVAEVTVSEQNKNFMGALHGGFLCALADLTAGKAALSYGVSCVTSNLTINYLKGCPSGLVRAMAKEIRRGKHLAVYQVDIYDETQALLATAVSTLDL